MHGQPSVAARDRIPAAFERVRDDVVELSRVWIEYGAESVLIDHGNGCHTVAGSATSDSIRLVATLETFDPPARLIVTGIDSDNARSRLEADARLLDGLAVARSQLSSTTAALVEANDQALAFYQLATGSSSSLSMVDIVGNLAEEARGLTGAPAVAIRVPTLPDTLCGDRELARVLVDMVCTGVGTESGMVRRHSSGLNHDVLIVPIGHEQPGWLIVAGPAGGRIHTPTQKLAAAIAGHLGGLLKLARTHQQELADARLRHEVEAASMLAAQVLPRRPPTVPGLDVHAHNQPARLASGDYFTWTMTERGLIFAVGDVSGKGLPAALVMTMLATATTAAAHRDRTGNPAQILAEINADVYDYLSDSGVFVTTAVCSWEPRSGVVSVVNAGHSPVLTVRRGRVEPVPPHVPPLGVLPCVDADVASFRLDTDDMLLLGSDGLVEQENADGMQYGHDRLAEAVARSRTTTAVELVDELFALLQSHSGDQPQDDDRTLLVVRRTREGP